MSVKTTETRTSARSPDPSNAAVSRAKAASTKPAANPASALSRNDRLDPDPSVENALESDVSTLIEDDDKSNESPDNYLEDVLGYADAFIDPPLVSHLSS